MQTQTGEKVAEVPSRPYAESVKTDVPCMPLRPARSIVTGYLHSGYAGSLRESGTPRALSHSHGWILERAIPGSSSRDGMGCYPLFACQDWTGLALDLEAAADDLVCLVVVTDPFGQYDLRLLEYCFPDKVIPFKEHFTADLSLPIDSFIHPHHRRYARKGLAALRVERCQNARSCLDEWVRLYSCLVYRHQITGIATFSRTAFAQQLEVPGLVAFRALCRDVTVGMLLWYVQRDIAYYHLGAHSPLGYERHSSFALFWRAMEYFTTMGVRWLCLGAGAGLRDDASDGLRRFKQGWSTGTRTAYLCGRIFDRRKYEQLVAAGHVANTSYFPAYRWAERSQAFAGDHSPANCSVKVTV